MVSNTRHVVSLSESNGWPSGDNGVEVKRSFRKTAHWVGRMISVHSGGLRRGSNNRISMPLFPMPQSVPRLNQIPRGPAMPLPQKYCYWN
jgi:hypothetical protein